MHPYLKLAVRFAAGMLILAAGLGITRMLIGMKEDAPMQPRKVAARPGKVVAANPGLVVPRIPLEGRVDAWERMDILAEVTGVLKPGGKEFREGVRFQAGEVMLRLDDSEWRAGVEGERGKFLQLLGGALADIRTDFPDRWAVWEAFVAGVDVRRSLPELPEPASQRERLFLANRGIVSSYHAIRSAEARGEKYRVAAPFTGVVGTALVDPGALVRAGTLVGTLVGGSAFEVKSAIHARYLPTLAVGDAVSFYEENGTEVARGSVVRMASQVDAATQSASVYCRIEALPGQSASLRDGRYLTGEARSRAIPDVVEVGLDAIQPDNTVFTVVEGRLKKAPIEVRFRGTQTALVAGLTSGLSLLAQPIPGAYEGMEIAQ